MKTMKLLIMVFALSVFSTLAYAQDDYSFYLQKARQRLAEGDCSRAETSYNTYKEMTQKTDKDIERFIRECKEGSQSGNSAEVQLAEGKYIGEIANGKPHGKGKMLFKDDDPRVSYEGDWVNGNQSGFGIMIWNDGTKYDGQWVNGNQSGFGIMIWNDGTKYDGQWVDGHRTGQGTCYWPSGNKYVGQWTDGNRTGRGTYYYREGGRYEGDWENGNKHGQGTYY